MKFGKLMLTIIIKIVVTRCHEKPEDFTEKCTKFDFGWGSAQDPTGRPYTAPASGCPRNPPSVLRASILRPPDITIPRIYGC